MGSLPTLSTIAFLPVKFAMRCLALLLCISSLTSAAIANERSPRPNVVIFFTDDQGTLDANCYGSTDLYTPNIDRLAKTGVRFTQAYAHMVCCPARAMLMTGRYPQRSGVNQWTQGNLKSVPGVNMAVEEVTLAEALKATGYRTALFGKWHLGAHRDFGPTRQGFDEFFGHRGGFIDNYNHFFLHGKGFHDLYEGTEEVFQRDEYFPDLMTARAVEYIAANKDAPFFMVVAFNLPHYPEQPDSQFDKRYANLPMPRRSYAKVISTVDDRIGRIVTALEENDVLDHTILVCMSDNGHSAETNEIRFDDHHSGLPKGHRYGANGGGGNTGKWLGHKATFFEGGIRVPLLVSYPAKLPAGIKRDQAVTAMDIYPTVLKLCGVEVPDDVKLDGHSLLPIINANANSQYEVMHWQWMRGWCVREGNWKLISNGQNEKLVNLADEQPEQTNHTADHPDVVTRLRKLHEEWTADVSPK